MDVTADMVADQLVPLDGPYQPEAVVAAAATVAELVRRLNHATYHASALPYPSQLYRVLGGLNAAMWGMQQLLGQLADRLDQFAGDPFLGHDQGDAQAGEAAAEAAVWLREAAAARWAVTDGLESAYRLTGHLSYRIEEEV